MARARFPSRVLGALLFLAGCTGAAAAQLPDSARLERRQVVGLGEPAEILIDHWGISHIYARSQRDAFFVQGYNAARDRLWQIDIWRKRGLGLLARDFGPDYVEQDRAARLFLYRGDLEREWAAYGPEARERAQAFVAGINAFVGEIRSGTRPLPVEFETAGTQPDLWSVDDVVRIRSHGLTRNVLSEVARARVACRGGLDHDWLRRRLEPEWSVRVPEGLDPCSIPADVLKVYELGTQPVRFAARNRLTEAREPSELDGSNAWVIAPSRTTTGRPILASDPHRALGVPSLRYAVHIDAPGLSVIGAGEPALPGVSIGHNGRIAFGLTIFAIDQEDLYVYELDPANADHYRYGAGYEPFRTIRETIPVRGEPDRTVELMFTRHGPVLMRDSGSGHAFALRSIWFGAGAAAYLGSLRYLTARNWTEFRAAVAEWRAPSENFLLAADNGEIGWVATGAAPRRGNWDGLLPVPGDGRYEWQGLIPADRLPAVSNPAAGFIASANEMNLPEGHPAEELRLGFEWADDSRARRLNQVLSQERRFSLQDSAALQADDHSTTALRLTRLLRTLEPEDPQLLEAIALLTSWDGRVGRESAAAALFEIWFSRHLGKSALARHVPEEIRTIIGSAWPDSVVTWLESPRTSAALRDDILRSSLRAAMVETRERLGADPARWSWGRLHRAHFRHALGPIANAALRTQMEVGPLQVGGDRTTTRLAAYRPDFTVSHGASFRMVIDVGAWDNSTMINSPGQSGDPFSPHYRDLFPLWAAGRQVPMLFSRGAVERATSTAIRLDPQ